MAVDLRSMTDTELDDLRIAVLLEQERRRVLSTAALNADAIADQYAAAAATEIAMDGTVVPQGGYAPGRLYRIGTIIWRNTSKTRLPPRRPRGRPRQSRTRSGTSSPTRARRTGACPPM